MFGHKTENDAKNLQVLALIELKNLSICLNFFLLIIQMENVYWKAEQRDWKSSTKT